MKIDLSAWLPFLRWWPRVNRTTTRADLIAGLSIGVLDISNAATKFRKSALIVDSL